MREGDEPKNPNYEAGFGSDALKNPLRVVFITRKTSAKVSDVGPQVMAYPHLLMREAIAFYVLVIALVSVALFWDAPLEQLANPLLTPNPAKAPWYFLGLAGVAALFSAAGGGNHHSDAGCGRLVVIPTST